MISKGGEDLPWVEGNAGLRPGGLSLISPDIIKYRSKLEGLRGLL